MSDFASHGVAEFQPRKWVDSKAKQGQSKALIKHILSHHIGPKPEDEQAFRDRGPCTCGYSEQEVLDMMDWSKPTRNAFYYSGPYRQYPRIIRRTRHLDHSRYARMIVGFKEVPQILTFFAGTGAVLPFDELQRLLDERFGCLWETECMRHWLFDATQSARTGMYNRWRKCELISPIVDAIAVAEVMLG